MFNEMFEIANQAYILQQQTDTEEIDDRNWREWTKLFRTQESIKAAYVEGKPDFDEDDDKIIGDTQIDTEEEALQKAEFTLDDEELTDYLQNQGQWKTNLITDEENKVNIEDILNSGEPAGGKPGKGGQTESKLLEEETVIPEDLPKNNILGDVIEKVIYLNYEGEEEIVKPDVPDHLPLKLAIIGQAFSGKKTQAQIISEKYNLKQYHAFELIEEALGRAGEDQEPIDEEHVEKEANTIEGEKVEEKPVEGENEGEGKQEIEGDKEGNVDTKVEGDVEDEQKEKSQTENQNVEPENEDKEKSQEEMPNEEQPEPNAEGENQENTEEAQDGEIKVEGEGEGNQENIEGTKEGPNEEVLDIEAEFERNGSHDDSHLMPKEEKFEKLRRNIFREIGKKMEQELLEGREIPEELVVDLLVSRIKADFAYKTQEQIDQDIKTIIEREEEIKEQLAKANELKGKSFRNTEPINEEILQKELEECSNFNKFGWILVDFPNSLQQASKLEAQLSGYLPEIDKEICLRNQKLTSACRIIEPSDKPNIRDTLINSGLDSVLWLETSREECRRRALGRRVDLANDTEYHIDDNPPSTTSPPLCERLMQVIEPERAEEVIPDKHLAFDKNTKRLRQWFEKFGYEEEEDETTKLELCQNVNGQSTGESDLINTNPNDIASNISVLDLIIQRKQSQWNAKREQFRNEIIAEKERIKQEEEERIRLEEEQKRKAEEEAKRAEEGEGEAEDKEEVHEDPPKEDEDQPKEEEEKEEKEEEEVVEEPPSKDNIDDDFAPVLMTIWDEIEAKYLRKMRKNFNLYRNQRNRIVTGLNKTQKYFVQYLNRPDTKQALLDEFVIAFNKFSDEYPDLREDEQTKEELHQRTDTLSDKLWEISEQRRDEAVEERQKIMENGWAEFELEQVVLIAQSMIQAEVDKFRNSAHLLQDYYYSIEDRLVPDPPEKIHYEIISKNEDGTIEELPPIFETVGESGEGEEAKEVYPRLDKLFERGLKAQTLPELESTPPGGAAGTDKKAGKAKDAKKGGAEEENEEKYFYEQELQDAISTEKAVLRYRLTLIRNWALNLMKEIRVKSSTCHDKLDIWIKIAFKAETDAIIEQERVIKRSIEEETKLQHELRIKGMDFYLDEKFLNFEDPPPEVFAAREEPQDSRFTIIQLESLVNELIVSSKDGLINNELLVDLLLARTINSKAFSDKNGVPPSLMN